MKLIWDQQPINSRPLVCKFQVSQFNYLITVLYSVLSSTWFRPICRVKTYQRKGHKYGIGLLIWHTSLSTPITAPICWCYKEIIFRGILHCLSLNSGSRPSIVNFTSFFFFSILCGFKTFSGRCSLFYHIILIQ